MLRKIECKLNKVLKDMKSGKIKPDVAFDRIMELQHKTPTDVWVKCRAKFYIAIAIYFRRRFGKKNEVSVLYYDLACNAA